MEVKLKVLNGTSAGRLLRIAGPEFLIGRAEGCQLRPRSEQISPRHCKLTIDKAALTIGDCGSSSGTFVNGQRIEQTRSLKNGDKLKVGPLEFEVSINTGLATKKRPRVTSVGEAAARATQMNQNDLDIGDWLADEQDQAAAAAPKKPVAFLTQADLDAQQAPSSPAATGSSKSDRGQASSSAEDPRAAAKDVLSKYRRQR